MMAARQGDAESQARLGQYFEEGLGVAQDYTQALRWTQEAAKRGVPEALARLGNFYDQGVGVGRDYKRAAESFLKAAEQGIPEAQERIAQYFERGLGVAQDHDEARKWFNRAAESGHPGAQFTLADAGMMAILDRIREADWEGELITGRRPRVQAYWQALKARPSYAATQPKFD